MHLHRHQSRSRLRHNLSQSGGTRMEPGNPLLRFKTPAEDDDDIPSVMSRRELQAMIERTKAEALQEHYSTLSAKAPLPPIAKHFVIAARLFAGGLMVVVWLLVVGPIWLAVLLRTISAFSFAAVVALFGGHQPPNPDRLDAISGLWVL